MTHREHNGVPRSSVTDVCARIAQAVMGAPMPVARLGSIVLTDEQRALAARAKRAFERHRGVLIAADVGTGKTFIALSITHAYDSVVVVAPAALRDTWRRACTRAARAVSLVSMESLARKGRLPQGTACVIVDEVHHARNHATRTYQALRDQVAGVPVVLLSATPLHNSARELDAILALFLGADARDLTDERRGELIVRAQAPPGVPPIEAHTPIAIRDDRRVLRAVNRLATSRSDALIQWTLLRAWCSSAAALEDTARRALLHVASHMDLADAGRTLSRKELRRAVGDDPAQLLLAALVGTVAGTGRPGGGAPPLRDDARDALRTLAQRRDVLDALRTLARAAKALDDQRAAAVWRIVQAHHGIPVLACAQYATTIRALWMRLRGHPGVAALTANGARIASGSSSRIAVLERFAPIAHGAKPPHPRERISLLLSTDLVSEGLNLHDAGVIVHLDLPLTAARLTQREGRIARIGSPHPRVHAYRIAPPRAAARALALQHRIERKRHLAATHVGGTGESAADARAAIARLLAPHAHAPPSPNAHELTCVVRQGSAAWLACVATGDAPRLVIRDARGISTDPRRVLALLRRLVGASELMLDAHALSRAVARPRRELHRWLANERARTLAGAGRTYAARAAAPTLARTMQALHATPAHARARHAAGLAVAATPSDQASPSPLVLALAIFLPQ